MTFAELKAELAARGFDYLDDTRQGLFINQALSELVDEDIWPNRLTETTTTGGVLDPVSINGPIIVQAVYDSTTNSRLKPIDLHSLIAMGADITQTGTPIYYYTRKSVSDPTVDALHTWPIGDSLTIWFYGTAPTLTGSSSPTQIPAKFHYLIVDIAVRMAYRDADDHEAAAATQVQTDRDLLRMRRVLLTDNVDGPDGYVQTTECW